MISVVVILCLVGVVSGINITNQTKIRLKHNINSTISNLPYKNISYCYFDDDRYLLNIIYKPIYDNGNRIIFNFIIEKKKNIDNNSCIMYLDNELYQCTYVVRGLAKTDNGKCVPRFPLLINWRVSCIGLLVLMSIFVIALWCILDRRVETACTSALYKFKIATKLIPSRGPLLT
ncbi:hypothetical protein nvc2_081 [Namao virus]|nr:hypothetical protein nvc2_081 [Namao virus]